VTVDELVADILPKGKQAVPETIKADLLKAVRQSVSRHRNNNSANGGGGFGRQYGVGGANHGFGSTSDL